MPSATIPSSICHSLMASPPGPRCCGPEADRSDPGEIGNLSPNGKPIVTGIAEWQEAVRWSGLSGSEKRIPQTDKA
jgi:hypothetical protein